MQTLDPSLLGYVDPEAALAKASRRRQRGMLLCARCRGLSHGKLTPGVAEPWMEREELALPQLASPPETSEDIYSEASAALASTSLRRLATPEELRAELAGLESQAALVALVVDCLDVPGSLLSGKSLRSLVGKNPVFLIGTRADLLPGFGDGFEEKGKGKKKKEGSRDGSRDSIIRPQALSTWLADAALRRKLSVAGAAAVSSRTRAGVPFAAASLRKSRAGRDVVVLGAANVGKSAFVRALVEEMRDVSGPQFDAAAAGVARRLPVASAVPGTTLGRIARAGFSAGGGLVDTPGLHLHHRLVHLLRPEEVGALQPTGPLRARRPPAPTPENPASAPASASPAPPAPPPKFAAESATYLWGGLARFDLELPPNSSLDIQFFGPAVLPLAALPIVRGEKEVSAEVVDAAIASAAAAVRARGGAAADESPSSSSPNPPPAFGRESVDARGGLRVSRVIDLKGNGLDVCVSGLPGWVALRRGETLTASSSKNRNSKDLRSYALEGRLTVWAPKGVEVFVRPPLPVEEPLMAQAKAGGGGGGMEEGDGWWSNV